MTCNSTCLILNNEWEEHMEAPVSKIKHCVSAFLGLSNVEMSLYDGQFIFSTIIFWFYKLLSKFKTRIYAFVGLSNLEMIKYDGQCTF